MTDLPPYVIKGQWVDPDPPWTGPRSHPYGDQAWVCVVTVDDGRQQWAFPSKAASDAWFGAHGVDRHPSLPDTLDVDEHYMEPAQ